MFLEPMIIYLLYWTDIIFGFTIILDNVNMDRFMIIRIEQKPKNIKTVGITKPIIILYAKIRKFPET